MTRQRVLFAAMTMVLGAISTSAQTFTDPVTYCRAVGTVDKPGSQYAGPKLPGWMAAKLNLKPDQANLMEWRCAKGAVFACVYGANIPCNAKAVISQKATPAIVEFCRQNPDSTFVPMVVTGHETTVSWTCHDTRPVVTKVGPVDSHGYAKAYWHRISN